jgi:hypothetical protein
VDGRPHRSITDSVFVSIPFFPETRLGLEKSDQNIRIRGYIKTDKHGRKVKKIKLGLGMYKVTQ